MPVEYTKEKATTNGSRRQFATQERDTIWGELQMTISEPGRAEEPPTRLEYRAYLYNKKKKGAGVSMAEREGEGWGGENWSYNFV